MTREEIKAMSPVLDHFVTLKRASLDKEKNEYMTESTIEVINFDKIPKEYARGKGWLGVPKSNDALYMDSSSWTFIEFKNGSIDKVDVYRKIYDSIIMLIDLKIVPDFDFVRNNISYILVCKKDRFSAQESPSRAAIYAHTQNCAKSETILFDLEKLKSFLLSEVHTYSPEEFEQNFVTPTEALLASLRDA